MYRTQTYLWSVVAATLMISTGSASTFKANNAQDICDRGDIEAVSTAYDPRANKAYDAIGSELFRYPSAEYDRPAVVARLEFAQACLKIRDEYNNDTQTDTCAAVRYLSRHDLFDRSDLRDLEDYYLRSRGKDVRGEGLTILKAAAGCY